MMDIMVRHPERLTVGVLALQGAFREHKQLVERIGAKVVEVRLPKDLSGIDGLILPGGESTTIGKLMVEWKLLEPIRALGLEGLPLWGTCAGSILLAKRITERGREMDQDRLGLLDITAVRNAFGRQRESFEADLAIKGLETPFHSIFIRAPLMDDTDSTEVLSEVDGKAVFLRQGKILASSFHPELGDDDRIHRAFLGLMEQG